MSGPAAPLLPGWSRHLRSAPATLTVDDVQSASVTFLRHHC